MIIQPGEQARPELELHPDVISAGPADLDTLSRVITDAFFDLPPSRWLVPDPDARREIFPAYFRLHVEDTLDSGVVHTTTGRAAVALWRRAGHRPATQPDRYGERLAAVAGPRTGRFLAFDEALDRHHPAGSAYHHLAILAVRPDRQGEGSGSALLRAYHRVLDRDAHGSVYLEAASLRARQLYLRHGYSDHGPLIQLPDGPLMYPMMRECRPAVPDAGR